MTSAGESGSDVLEERLVRLALKLAGEPTEREAPWYREVHPYSSFRAGLARPFSISLVRAVRDTMSDRWEADRVATLVAAAGGNRWSMTDVDRIMRSVDAPRMQIEYALDLLIHAYLQMV